jgi:hypothetical protein
MSSVVIGHENSSTPGKMPEETCDIHTSPTFPGMFTQEVYICRIPLMKQTLPANIPRAMENGGSPEEYLD